MSTKKDQVQTFTYLEEKFKVLEDNSLLWLQLSRERNQSIIGIQKVASDYCLNLRNFKN
jgi:hypothetical protein